MLNALPISMRSSRGLLALAMLRSYWKVYRRLPRLHRPRRYSDAIQYAKLHWRSPLMVTLADKVAAKAHVAQVLGDEWIIPTLYAGPALPPRAQRNWPIPHAIKVNHRSGGNIFIRSRADQDWPAIEARLGRWLAQPHGLHLGEWVYSQIPPKVLVEPIIGGPEGPVDYKFNVFDGQVRVIEVHSDRFVGHRCAMLSPQWDRYDVGWRLPADPSPIPPPKSLVAMMAAAVTLAADFPHARIDFYEIDGRPLFGEVTFYPDSGHTQFEPDSFDFLLGSLYARHALPPRHSAPHHHAARKEARWRQW